MIRNNIDPLDNQASDSCESTLENQNIFQAITRSKHEANELKQDSDNIIFYSRDVSANRISNPKDLQTALKRVEQLWNAKYHSAEGNEQHKLADLICDMKIKAGIVFLSKFHWLMTTLCQKD